MQYMTNDVGVLVFACLSSDPKTARGLAEAVEARRRANGVEEPAVPVATVIYHLEAFEDTGLVQAGRVPGEKYYQYWLTETALSRKATHPLLATPSRPSFKPVLVRND